MKRNKFGEEYSKEMLEERLEQGRNNKITKQRKRRSEPKANR